MLSRIIALVGAESAPGRAPDHGGHRRRDLGDPADARSRRCPTCRDVQVIVQADYSEQAPRIVEDQVTYPIAAEMLKVPGARTVRGYSFFGVSFVYVIFEDGTDLYWARTRVLEYLNGIKGKLPASVTPHARARCHRPRLGLPVRARGHHRTHEPRRAAERCRTGISATRSRRVPGVSRGRDRRRVREAVPGRPRSGASCQAYGIPITRGHGRHPERQRRRRRHGDGALRARVHGARARLPQVDRRHRERRRRRHRRAARRSGWPSWAA